MATNFPNGVDLFPGVTPTYLAGSDGNEHTRRHLDVEDAVTAMQQHLLSTRVPSASRARSTEQSVASGTNMAIIWNVDIFNNGMFSGGQPTRFTAPKAGLYQVNLMTSSSGHSALRGRRYQWVQVIGSPTRYAEMQVEAFLSPTVTYLNSSALVPMNAGQSLEAWFHHTLGTPGSDPWHISTAQIQIYWVSP